MRAIGGWALLCAHRSTWARQADARQLFEQLLEARDGQFERGRERLFANPAAVRYLVQRFDDRDPVTAFIARQLHLCATSEPKQFGELKTFFEVTEPAIRKADKTARGGGGSNALFDHLETYGYDERGMHPLVAKHLLMHALTRPGAHGYIYGTLLQYYATFQVPEPEVWIRIAVIDGDANVIGQVAETSLPRVPPKRLLAALEREYAHALRKKFAWPQAFGKLRRTLPVVS